MAKTILLTRHGEKPDNPFNPNLSKQGQERAEFLSRYIPDKFGAPDFVFAAETSKHSARPVETVEPLCQKLGLKLNANYADQDFEALASVILGQIEYEGKLILICWHHGHIPAFARALGAASNFPDPWPEEEFGLVLKIDSGQETAVTQIKEPELVAVAG